MYREERYFYYFIIILCVLALLVSPLIFKKLYGFSDDVVKTIEPVEYLNENIQATHVVLNLSNFEHITKIGYEIGDFYGNSMQPTLFEGNKVILMRIPPNYIIKTGDIIRYVDPDTGNKIIHRVEANYRDYIVTKGDNIINKKEFVKINSVTHLIVGVIYV